MPRRPSLLGPCLASRGGVCPKLEGVCPGFAQGLPRGLPARRHSFTEGSVAHRPTFCVFGTHGCAWGFVGCMGEHERTSRSWLHPRDWPCCSCWTALLMRQCLVRTVRAGRSVLVSVSTCNVESCFCSSWARSLLHCEGSRNTQSYAPLPLSGGGWHQRSGTRASTPTCPGASRPAGTA